VTFAAILSDLDGVLVDSTASVERNWRAWLARVGPPADTLDGRMHGRPSPVVIAEPAPELDLSVEHVLDDPPGAGPTGSRSPSCRPP
jgi:beta-phosphoglucomutase-like phosphatase (HAD superfamily)